MMLTNLKKPLACLSLAALLLGACDGVKPASSDSNDPSSSEDKRINDERNLDDFAYTVNSLTGTDALGRSFKATNRENGKSVGMFYFLWHGTHEKGIYDITQLLVNSPDKPLDPKTSPESPVNQFHYWGKPLYGYYDSADPFVIARHLELFVMAGIDYLVFDTTNTVTYNNVVYALSDIFLQYQTMGWKVPKLAFYCNSASAKTVETIYDFYYKGQPQYRPLWYMVEGKPLIIANTADFADEQYQRFDEFFTIKESQWPDALPRLNDGFPWQDWRYPQLNYRGTVSVSVAQGPGYNMADPKTSWGRGFDFSSMKNISEKAGEGINFESEWQTAINPDQETGEVKDAFVTAWNEWMAIKQVINDKVVFCDEYNEEFSRDCEMEDGVLGDNFYLQLIRNIRAFKYEKADRFLYPSVNIDFENPESWNAVKNAYLDFVGDAMVRNHRDCLIQNGGRYVDETARNDIANIKVAHDDKNLYFRIETKNDLTVPEENDSKWMNVLLNSYQEGERFGMNFDYRINGTRQGDSCSIERYQKNRWVKVSSASFKYSGNVLQLAVPLSAIGKSEQDLHCSFKVTDNIAKPDDIMDYYVSGDSAPLGRMAYEYGY